MNGLLFDEHPLVILPSLAKLIGLNEAILLQQIHYWVKNSDKVIEGRKWTYNTYDDWLVQFPFWSKSTLRRSVAKLEEMGILITDNFNKMRVDKTKWYSIDYEKLRGLSSPCVQNEQSMCSKWADGSVQNEPSNTLDYSKTSTETSSIPYTDVINYLNHATGKTFKDTSKKTKTLIKARWNEGFGLEDFMTVINNKAREWLHDPKMNEYLRPETLFGPKFEGYLNQQVVKSRSEIPKAFQSLQDWGNEF